MGVSPCRDSQRSIHTNPNPKAQENIVEEGAERMMEEQEHGEGCHRIMSSGCDMASDSRTHCRSDCDVLHKTEPVNIPPWMGEEP